MRNQKSPQVDTTFKSQLLFKNFVVTTISLRKRSKFSVKPDTHAANGFTQCHSPFEKIGPQSAETKHVFFRGFFLLWLLFKVAMASHPQKRMVLGVSKNRYPKMDGLLWKTLLKWMIWRYNYFRKHPLGKICFLLSNMLSRLAISFCNLFWDGEKKTRDPFNGPGC